MTRYARSSGELGSGFIRTVFLFMDLPVHVELRAGPMPLIPVRTVIEFDEIRIQDPTRRSRVWAVSGPHVVERTKFTYSSRRASLTGLTQFLEMKQVSLGSR